MMQRRNNQLQTGTLNTFQWAVVASALLTATVAAQSTPSHPVQAAAAAKTSPAAPEGEETETPDKPGTQGLKIHGHWVLDIKNPDGTLAKHLDFQNSLTTGGGGGNTVYATGDQLLGALLSGNGVISDPGILFIGLLPAAPTFAAGSDITSQCQSASSSTCQFLTTPQSLLSSPVTTQDIFASNAGITGSNASAQTGLGITVKYSPGVSWVLTGNWTVPSGMNTLTAVQTWLPLCLANYNNTYQPTGGFYPVLPTFVGSGNDRNAAALTMAGCTASTITTNSFTTAGPLTSTYVPGAPQTIVPGQIVTVTVTITFS